MAGSFYDSQTNIFIDVFRERFCTLNPDKANLFDQTLQDIRFELSNDDIGKAFYKRLSDESVKLIDFKDPSRNKFHYTAEFTCKNGLEEFRPDITLFINGLPSYILRSKNRTIKRVLLQNAIESIIGVCLTSVFSSIGVRRLRGNSLPVP